MRVLVTEMFLMFILKPTLSILLEAITKIISFRHFCLFKRMRINMYLITLGRQILLLPIYNIRLTDQEYITVKLSYPRPKEKQEVLAHCYRHNIIFLTSI